MAADVSQSPTADADSPGRPAITECWGLAFLLACSLPPVADDSLVRLLRLLLLTYGILNALFALAYLAGEGKDLSKHDRLVLVTRIVNRLMGIPDVVLHPEQERGCVSDESFD